jgi:5-methylcytosine-specific restriction endonuclease McrA
MKTYDLKDSFEEYKDAVQRLRTAAKSELQGIETSIKKCYDNYEEKFKLNNLECLQSDSVAKEHKDALLSMYDSKKALIIKFRKRFFEINKQTYNNLCPYCVISESDTTEHILPKEDFPEFAVDVLNLIPCCSLCNSIKDNDIIDKSGERLFLNFYTDFLPDTQFLFVDITAKPDINFEYRLENVNNKIDANLFGLIERHYNKLNLLSRYKEKAIQSFAEITNTYLAQGFKNEASYDIFVNTQLKACAMNNAAYGINHWKMVLENACATSIVFKQYIMSNITSTP